MALTDKVYHKKRFYKVTWERSEALLKAVPWLTDETRDYCMVGYREPTFEEAERFIGDIMHDRLFDTVTAVCEISKKEALRDFQMDDWKHQKVFGVEEVHRFRASLAEKLQDATDRAKAGEHGERDVGRDLGY